MSLKERFERLYDSFSFRQRDTNVADDLAPDDLVSVTDTFRSGVILFWCDLIDGVPLIKADFGHDPLLVSFWEEMHKQLQHLYRRPRLCNPRALDVVNDDLFPFLRECETDQFFDFMEQAFQLPISWRLQSGAAEIIDALNVMFRHEELPYEMTNLVMHEEVVDDDDYFGHPFDDEPRTKPVIDARPQVIRVDEQVPHREAIQPALAALSAPHFKQANGEFLKALRHYRDDEFADCLTACGSALDSVLKVICDQKKWAYDDQQKRESLLNAVVDRTSLDPFFKSTLLIVGNIRNRLSSAHGQGPEERHVPRHIAQYALTSTAAAIILLITETETDR